MIIFCFVFDLILFFIFPKKKAFAVLLKVLLAYVYDLINEFLSSWSHLSTFIQPKVALENHTFSYNIYSFMQMW